MGARITCPLCGQTNRYEAKDAETVDVINAKGVKITAFMYWDCPNCKGKPSISVNKWKEISEEEK